MYLLDANVVSEMRRRKPHPAVVAWFDSIDAKLLRVPASVLGEIQRGIEITKVQNVIRAVELEKWVAQIENSYRIVAMDGPSFREWARLMHGKSAHLLEDAMIAATARIHGFTVVTRNVRDFKSLDVAVLNPFSYRA